MRPGRLLSACLHRRLRRAQLCPLRFSLVLLGLLSAIVPWGCAQQAPEGNSGGLGGYRSYGIYPQGIQTVAVPIFENQTLVTGLEREITDALIKEIESRTPYSVASSNTADTILIGTIVRVSKRKLSEKRGSGLVQEVMQTVTIDFEWKDVRSGRILTQRRDFSAGDIFIPSTPVGERPEFGRFVIAAELARDVVAEMRGEW